eukprot:TRINITY_DN40482_c0_g1_i1.p1 TRINITY_DN40482_c0_g1~~TRINITY_DN40482_c0_g1_i1.p1  ORF type:complete len:542 (+),score=115.61 TRINITY_DN40482_c0_g1_i1:73-1698(+)
MVHSILAAADLGGSKCNFELMFAGPPSLQEFRQRAHAVLTFERSLRLPGAEGQFTPERTQVFDEGMQMWVELVAAPQLVEWAQVYFFQKETMRHRESAGRIPPPVRPSNDEAANKLLKSRASPLRCTSPPVVQTMPAGAVADVPVSEKVRAAFVELDSKGARVLSEDAWVAGFERLRLGGAEGAFGAETVLQLFRRADADGDGVISFSDWGLFASLLPKLLDAVYWRGVLAVQDAERVDRVTAARGVTAELEQRLRAARETANDAEQSALGQQDAVKGAADQVASAQTADQAALRGRNEAKSATEEAKALLRELEDQKNELRDDAHRAESELRNAQRVVAQAEKQLDIRRHAVEDAKAELEALRKKLADQEALLRKRERERDEASEGVQRSQLGSMRAREEQERVEQEFLIVAAQCAAQESELKGLLETENVRSKAHTETSRELVLAQARKASEEQELSRGRGKFHSSRGSEHKLEQELSDHRRLLVALERREMEIAQRRMQEEMRESAVLEQEFKLLEQRCAVLDQEAALHRFHSLYACG